MIIETPDTPTGTTALPKSTPVLLTAGGTPVSTPVQNASNADLRERIHRVAAMAHEAIDKLEQRLGSTSQGLMATQAKGGEQVRQYGDQLRQRVSTQPMQAIGIALGAGFVLAKLFGGKPKVHVVRVPEPMPMPSRWNDLSGAAERRTSGLMDAARSHIERLGDLAHAARDRVSATASQGVEGAQDMTTSMARTASAVPAQMRDTMERLLSRSQDYGSSARSAIQEHPAAGLGAALGLGALVAVLLARR
jgi:ElaB/YqjD/DUF883 family membrane-anchored ribosome-binding protein